MKLFRLVKDIFITIAGLVFVCVVLLIHVLIFVTLLWPLQILGTILFMTVMIIAGILPEKIGDRFVVFCDHISAPFLRIIKKIFGDFGSRHGSVSRAFHMDSGDFD
ncbi:MAG: hypothetical protein IKC82_02705 [Lentisphaeria bacterium]|nr:hypothetical protein [Lentisphaeria bacterium]